MLYSVSIIQTEKWEMEPLTAQMRMTASDFSFVLKGVQVPKKTTALLNQKYLLRCCSSGVLLSMLTFLKIHLWRNWLLSSSLFSEVQFPPLVLLPDFPSGYEISLKVTYAGELQAGSKQLLETSHSYMHILCVRRQQNEETPALNSAEPRAGQLSASTRKEHSGQHHRGPSGHRQRNSGPHISGTREGREPFFCLGEQRIMYKNLILSGRTIPLLNTIALWRLFEDLEIFSPQSHVSYYLQTLHVQDPSEMSNWFTVFGFSNSKCHLPPSRAASHCSLFSY